MPARDDLDALIDDLAEDDPGIHLRVAAALERRQLARDLAHRRRDAGMPQADIASRMGTSQGQITRFESGADTRLSTVARYAAALGVRVEWTITPDSKSPTKKSATANRGKVTAVRLRRWLRRVVRTCSTRGAGGGRFTDSGLRAGVAGRAGAMATVIDDPEIVSSAARGTRRSRPNATTGSPSRPSVSRQTRASSYAAVRPIRKTRAASSTVKKSGWSGAVGGIGAPPCEPQARIDKCRQRYDHR